jgi:hypothetical protein
MSQGDSPVAHAVSGDSPETKAENRKPKNRKIRVWAWLERKEFELLERIRKKPGLGPKKRGLGRSEAIRLCVRAGVSRRDLVF